MKKLLVLLLVLCSTAFSTATMARPRYHDGFYFYYGPGYSYYPYYTSRYYYYPRSSYRRCWWRHGHRVCRYYRNYNHWGYGW